MSIYAYVDIYVSIQLTVYSSVCCHIWQYTYSSQVIQIVHISTNICLYMHILTYMYLYSPNSVLECCHICQYSYNSQVIQICSRIYKYMSIYAYIDIYVSIQLTAYSSVCCHICQYAYNSQGIQIFHVSTNICLYTHILTYIYRYCSNCVLECMLPSILVCKCIYPYTIHPAQTP